MINSQIVARALNGTVTGRYSVSAPGPGHSARDRSLSIKMDPNAPLGFLVFSHAGDDPLVCRDHVQQRLCVEPWAANHNRRFPAIRPDKANGRHDRASWLWSQRRPISIDTPVARYLSKRGFSDRVPSTLGYLPARGRYPAAMIAAFHLAPELEPGLIGSPSVRGVHLTRVSEDGHKAPNAAGVAKIMIGACKGNPILVAPPNDLLGLAITEGIEDGLSVHQATGLGVWAAGAAGFMPTLAPLVPDFIECVTIFAHDDTAGRRGALKLAQALHHRRIEVFIEGLR
jgi:hypothetical protein